MKQMFASRIPAVMAAILFAAATFLNAAADRDSAPTTIVLTHPAQTPENIASNR